MIIGTRAEFEKLADYILKDYLGNDYESYLPLDVQDFAKNYLKLEILYHDFDPRENIEGMLVNDHIILDSRLKNRERTGERNFTIAHECGHYLINCQENMPCMYTEYRFNRTKRLITENDFREWQANVVAVVFLCDRLDEIIVEVLKVFGRFLLLIHPRIVRSAFPVTMLTEWFIYGH